MLKVGVGEVLEHPARAPGVDRLRGSGDRPVGGGPGPRGGAGVERHGVLELEALVAVDEAVASGRRPPRHEGVQQRLDGLAWQRATEELRPGVEAELPDQLGGIGPGS